MTNYNNALSLYIPMIIHRWTIFPLFVSFLLFNIFFTYLHWHAIISEFFHRLTASGSTLKWIVMTDCHENGATLQLGKLQCVILLLLDSFCLHFLPAIFYGLLKLFQYIPNIFGKYFILNCSCLFAFSNVCNILSYEQFKVISREKVEYFV